MMNKAQLKRDLSASVNGAGMMRPKDVQKFLGCCKETARKWLMDVDATGEFKGKMYSVDDIADKLMKSRIIGGK